MLYTLLVSEASSLARSLAGTVLSCGGHLMDYSHSMSTGKVCGCQNLIIGKAHGTEEKRKQQTEQPSKIIMQFLEHSKMPREAGSPSFALYFS